MSQLPVSPLLQGRHTTFVSASVSEGRSGWVGRVSFRASVASRGIEGFRAEESGVAAIPKADADFADFADLADGLHEAVGAHLRHQRDLRDLRRLLEDAMGPPAPIYFLR